MRFVIITCLFNIFLIEFSAAAQPWQAEIFQPDAGDDEGAGNDCEVDSDVSTPE